MVCPCLVNAARHDDINIMSLDVMLSGQVGNEGNTGMVVVGDGHADMMLGSMEDFGDDKGMVVVGGGHVDMMLGSMNDLGRVVVGDADSVVGNMEGPVTSDVMLGDQVDNEANTGMEKVGDGDADRRLNTVAQLLCDNNQRYQIPRIFLVHSSPQKTSWG